MDIVLLLARVLLAAVFTLAGLTKLVDRDGSRQALLEFGVPATLAASLGVLLPLAELVVAIALIPTATAWWGAIGALTLLLFFIAEIGYNLIRGRKPDCHCFGQLYSAPIGGPTLVRNSILAAIAGLVVWQGGDNAGASVVGWLSSLTLVQSVTLVGGMLLFGLLVAEGWLLLHLLGQNGRLLVRLEALEARLADGGMALSTDEGAAEPEAGLPIGAPAPPFSLPELHGETLTLEALRAPGSPVLLIFSDPGCGPCMSLLPDISRWQRDYAHKLTVVVMSRGAADVNRAKCTEHGLTHVLLEQGFAVAQAYQVVGTPSAVLVRADGTIGSPLAVGPDAIRALVRDGVGGPPIIPLAAAPARASNGGTGAAKIPARPLAPKIGEPAPLLELPEVDGRLVGLADVQGSETLVLFWNPGCGFCSRMLDDVKALEKEPEAPKLLLVATGTAEANKAMGFQSPVVLDQSFAVGRAFGATGTPSAIRIDAAGRIASPLAVGAPAILELARTGQLQTRPAPA